MGSTGKSSKGRAFDGFRLSLVLIPCLLFVPELIGYSRFAGWDVTRLNLPLKWFDVQAVREGVLPLWNHYLYAGMPHLAESESGLFYPGNLLMHLPGDFFYWANLTIIAHFILAGIFADIWLRGRGVRKEIAFFGAALYQTAPFLLFHITSMALLQSIAWFPLILRLADKVMDARESRDVRIHIGNLGLMGGLLMVVGNGQMAFYQGFLAAFYLLGHVLVSKQHMLKRLFRGIGALVAMALGAFLLGSIIWIPAREFAETTVRETAGGGFYQLGTWLTPARLASAFYFPAYAKPEETVGWASSLIYVGLLPVLLALIRFAGIKVNWKKDAPLIVMGGVALFLAFGWNNPVNHFLVRFEPYSMFRYQGRMAIGVLVAMIALAVHLLSGIGQEKDEAESGAASSAPTKVLLWLGANPGAASSAPAWCLGVVLVGFIAFILTASRAPTILVGGIVLIIDALLCWWAFSSLLKNKGQLKFPLWLGVYLVFHLIIVTPVGRLATIKTEVLNDALTFFDRLERSDGLPPRLLVADVGMFADLDLTKFNLFGPQDSLPNLCAGNTSVFGGVQTMDPYTPLRPREWHKLIRETILPAFIESENTVLDRSTANLLQALGIDAVVTSGKCLVLPAQDNQALGIDSVVTSGKCLVLPAQDNQAIGIDGVVTSGSITEIPGFRLQESDLQPAFGPDARLFVTETEQPRIWMTGRQPDRFGSAETGDLITGLESIPLERMAGREGEFSGTLELVPNGIIARFSTGSPGWVVVETSFAENWDARLQDQSVTVNSAGVVFCAVEIESAGDYEIEFEYKNKSGLLSSYGFFIGLILYVLWIGTALLFPFLRKNL